MDSERGFSSDGDAARMSLRTGERVCRGRYAAERKAQASIFKQALAPGLDMDGPLLKRAGTILFLGTGQFAFFFSLAEIYYPGYSVSFNTISDLGATCSNGVCEFFQPSSDIFNSSIVLLGLSLFLFAYYLWKGSGSKSLSIFEFFSGIGAVGVGVFNESYGGAHVFFSAFIFFSTGIQALLVYKVAKPPFSYASAVAGLITLVAIVLYGTHAYLGLGQGGMERMIVYPALIQGIWFGAYLMALGGEYRI